MSRLVFPITVLSLALTHCAPSDESVEADVGSGGSSSSTMPDGGQDAEGGAGGDGGGVGGSGSGAGGAGAGPPGAVPAFIATGHMGRKTISCDDGQSWIADQSLDDAVRCFEPLDCDHNEGGNTGVIYGAGLFVASFGWGAPGTIQRSRDGVVWETVLSEPTFAGIAFGNDTFIAGARMMQRSGADALTWSEPIDTGMNVWSPRGTGFVPHDGGLFLIGGGNADDQDMVISSDNGDSWWHPTVVDGCAASNRRFAYGDGVIVAAQYDAVCSSTDGGDTWTRYDLATDVRSAPIWTGTKFMLWGPDTYYESTDGSTWTSASISPDNVRLGAVAMSDEGTFVSVRSAWLGWYEEQVFYRSEDGINWQALPSGNFVGSHPIGHIAFGYVQPSDDGCAAP